MSNGRERTDDARLSSLETVVGGYGERFDKLEGVLDHIARQISDLRVPNISMWLTAAGVAVAISGVFVTVGVAIGSMAISSQNREMYRIEAYTRERADQNRDGIAALDTSLQREMRGLDEVMKTQISELDKRLQHEMRLEIGQLAERTRAERAELEIRILRDKARK
jgi:hypothetical protein